MKNLNKMTKVNGEIKYSKHISSEHLELMLKRAFLADRLLWVNRVIAGHKETV